MSEYERQSERAEKAQEQYRRRRKWIIWAAVGTVIAVPLLVLGVNMTWAKADGGSVIVVRNGGIFDDNSFREVVQPNSSLTFVGMASQEHKYPASQRYFKAGGGGADTSEVINVPTKDGVNVGVEGTWYFELTTDAAALQTFDDEFGTRTFPAPVEGDTERRLAPWDGDEGWSRFLDAMLSPAALTASLDAIGKYECKQLIASCALIRGGAAAEAVTAAVETTDLSTYATISADMQAKFEEEIDKVLGADVLVNLSFQLQRVTLPQGVQDSINAAFQKITDANGAAQAAVDTAKGETNASLQRVETAKNDAASAIEKQNGYNACPVCQEIDLRKAIPPSITVWAPGADSTVPVR